MKLRMLSYLLTGVAALVLVSLVGLGWVRHRPPTLPQEKTLLIVQASAPATQARIVATAPTPQVVLGTPIAYTPPPEPTRYTYRNDFPADSSKRLPLYLIDMDGKAPPRVNWANWRTPTRCVTPCSTLLPPRKLPTM